MLERERILVTGAGGQLGQELVRTLVALYGEDRVIASDLDALAEKKFPYCRFEAINVFNTEHLVRVIKKNKVVQIYHLAAVLSATGEQAPLDAWLVNVQGLLNILELARTHKLERVFWPSSIAVFGGNSQKKGSPQHSVIQPDTVYGISKAAGELWCRYYHQRYGLDVRSLRFPGLIGHRSRPGGGTTDYAVDIFQHAVRGKRYNCYLKPDTRLPMMYMPDAIKAALDLMRAPERQIAIRTSYNVSSMSFTPEELYHSIKRFHPGFRIEYRPDERQMIADSWPLSIDDSRAREDWGHRPKYDLDFMTEDMLNNLEQGSKVSLQT